MHDEYYMGFALKEAEKALILDEVPIGAVIVCDHQILATAHNETETRHSALAHAEMIALQKLNEKKMDWRSLNCTIYVTLEPCAMCAGALVLNRIARVVYGLANYKSGACGTLYNIAHDDRLNHRIEISSGIRAEESHLMLQSFFAYNRYRNKMHIKS